MFKLGLLRHGESFWNKENRFTGWTDIDLSEKGVAEAKKAGQLLEKAGFTFDMAYTSVLKRAIHTLWIVQDEMDFAWIPVFCSWRLNEKSYGTLQGLNKSETAKKYGEEQVLKWRRRYDVKSPELEISDTRHPVHESKYKNIDKELLPATECLKDTVERFSPYWHETIKPSIIKKQKILIVAHGNSLRALVKHLDNLSDKEILKIIIPTRIPLVYDLDNHLKVKKSYYLGNQDAINKAINSVRNQGKTKTK